MRLIGAQVKPKSCEALGFLLACRFRLSTCATGAISALEGFSKSAGGVCSAHYLLQQVHDLLGCLCHDDLDVLRLHFRLMRQRLLRPPLPDGRFPARLGL